MNPKFREENQCLEVFLHTSASTIDVQSAVTRFANLIFTGLEALI